jgi:hypothetical protein
MPTHPISKNNLNNSLFGRADKKIGEKLIKISNMDRIVKFFKVKYPVIFLRSKVRRGFLSPGVIGVVG